MRRLLALFLVVAAGDAAAAEPFSVRCESETPATPYFVTLDIERKLAVMETPPIHAPPDEGINLMSGEIEPPGQREDGRIAIFLRSSSGKMSLVLDTQNKTMIWPGLQSGTFRPALRHRCTFGAARSILSFRSRDPIIDPISVRCSEAGHMYFTMDVKSTKALFERGQEGRSFEGRVSGTHGDIIDLTMDFGYPSRVSWDRNGKVMTVQDSQGGPDKTMTCEEVAPRTMIGRYDARF